MAHRHGEPRFERGQGLIPASNQFEPNVVRLRRARQCGIGFEAPWRCAQICMQIDEAIEQFLDDSPRSGFGQRIVTEGKILLLVAFDRAREQIFLLSNTR